MSAYNVQCTLPGGVDIISTVTVPSPSSSDAGAFVSAVIGGLNGTMTYCFQVQAVSAQGASAWSRTTPLSCVAILVAPPRYYI